MCGICGVLHFVARPVASKDVERMMEAIIHRGPDDSGTLFDGPVGFGFRRLSIVDLSLGHQPMANEDESLWIVFNGEVYNHKELRRELLVKGHLYRTQSDTETILHLYEEHGVGALQRLNGMFALAIWDTRKKRLFLARDRLGIKPLYYSSDRERLIFASEIKALLEYPGVFRKVNLEAFREFLTFRYVAGRHTMFEGIFSLQPGEFLIAEGDSLAVQTYWDIPRRSEVRRAPADNLTDELEVLLRDSVSLQLMADVPLGSMASGGIDSSLVAGYAAEIGNFKLNTYSVGFQEPDFDETQFARLVRDIFSTIHHECIVTNADFANYLSAMIWHNDEPLSHPNSVAIFLLSRLARQRVTVLLTGEGPDEEFCGYPRYFIPYLFGHVPALPRKLRWMIKTLLGMVPNRKLRKLASFSLSSEKELLVNNSAFVDPAMVNALCLPDVPLSPLEYRFKCVAGNPRTLDEVFDDFTYLELKTYLVAILHRMDKMTMAASIEGRVPYLDHRIVEWSRTLGLADKLRFPRTKVVVRKLARRSLPQSIISRPKFGFAVPLDSWFRDSHNLGRHLPLLSEKHSAIRQFVRSSKLEEVIDEHTTGTNNHGELLWNLLNLELWHRIFIDRTFDPHSATL